MNHDTPVTNVNTKPHTNSRGKLCCRHCFHIQMITHLNLFGGQMIDHRKRFDGEMIALMNGKPVYFSDDRSTEISAGHKSDHLPAKLFPMIDQRNKVPVRRAIISPSNRFR